MKAFLTTLAVIFVATLLILISKYISYFTLDLNDNLFINNILKYQLVTFFLAIIVLILTLVISPESKTLLTVGKVKNIASSEKWLGIDGKTSWLSNGLQLLFVISLTTGIFMYLQVNQTHSLSNFQFKYLPLIIFISLANSFTEEIIFRFAVNGNLINYKSKIVVLLISAITFGLPHYFGNPSGVVGVLMAGILGYVLSKATMETKGLGLPWLIHFVQDVIIISALFMMNVQ